MRPIPDRAEFDALPYAERPENITGPTAATWADINAHWGTTATCAREVAFNQRLQDAQNEATKRETKLRVDAAAARRSVDGLRGTVYQIRASLPNAFPATVLERADTAAELLGVCVDECRSVAESADRHAVDSLMLLEAWPK